MSSIADAGSIARDLSYRIAPVFLIGYMGCGKTTLGRAVARVANVDFIDLDLYIENRFRRKIAEIFAERGEDGFRVMERNMLHEVAEFENVIVACGGGTPCFFDNMDYMNSRGTTVLLEASSPRMLERLCRGKAKRPLIAGMSDSEIADYTARVIEQRMPYYSKAVCTFLSDELENRREIDGSVERFIALTGLPLRESSNILKQPLDIWNHQHQCLSRRSMRQSGDQ